MPEIKTIIWDFGGVITSSPFEAFARYEQEHSLPRDFIRTINATNPDSNAWARFERSEISAAQFDEAFASESEAAGHRVQGADVLLLLSGDIRPDMVALIKNLKEKNYMQACITNNVNSGEGAGMATSEAKAQAVAKVMQLFDHIFESSKIGIRKPDPEIYKLALKVLGVDAKQCVFLDDLGINLKPARALGMATIKVVSAEQAISELKMLLGN